MAQRRGLLLLAQAARDSTQNCTGCSWRGLASVYQSAQARPPVALTFNSQPPHSAKSFSTQSPVLQGQEQQSLRYWEWLLLIPGITTFGLGTWQLQRKEEKEKLLEIRRRQLEQDPIPLAKAVAIANAQHGGDLPTAESLEYKRVVCTGEFDESRNLYLGPRVRTVYGVPEKGFYVITPLVPSPNASSLGPAVLVNRGWVPSSWREERYVAACERKSLPAHEGSPSGEGSQNESTGGSKEQPARGGAEEIKLEASIVGVIRTSEQPSSFVPSNAPSFAQWFYVDVPAMARACDLPENTIVVDLVRDNREAPPGPLQFPLPKDPNDLIHARVMPQDHLNYALTWFTLSGATTFMAWKRLQPKRKPRR